MDKKKIVLWGAVGCVVGCLLSYFPWWAIIILGAAVVFLVNRYFPSASLVSLVIGGIIGGIFHHMVAILIWVALAIAIILAVVVAYLNVTKPKAT
jgi:glycerol-3-phosphate acyltransferase PlsY